MKIKVLIMSLLCAAASGVYAADGHSDTDSIAVDTILQKTDSVVMSVAPDTLMTKKEIQYIVSEKTSLPDSTLLNIKKDTVLYQANPFFIELIYLGKPLNFHPRWKEQMVNIHFPTLKKKYPSPLPPYSIGTKWKSDSIICDLRQQARVEILKHSAGLYATTLDRLPSPAKFRSRIIYGNPTNDLIPVDNSVIDKNVKKKINVRKDRIYPWSHKLVLQSQISQNYVSSNWYQGGNSNLAVLNILNGQLNYDDRDKVQWENSLEWHMGFYSVFRDTTALRTLNTNDDVFKITSKVGYKMNGNWYYSCSFDLSTVFFKNYQSVSSNVMKADFLTPVRINVGLGMDYKYKKIFSLALSPLTYKFIYANDTAQVDPNLFGIESGKSMLKELGSSVKATFSYQIKKMIQLDSKLTFYTNYDDVEVDWETVLNFTINRFFSTRVSFYPRYDNTVILPNGQKPDIQLKQFVSFGFSYKFQ